MFRLEKEAFAGVGKDAILKALRAEGIPASGGYKPLNKEPFLETAFATPGWRAIYGEKAMREWAGRNECSVNELLCNQAIWLTQTMLLGTRQDMEQVAAALRKVQSQAGELRKA